MARPQMATFPGANAQLPWTTIELMRVWDEIAYPAPSFIRDNLFAGEEITSADTLAVDYLNGAQLIAPWVSKISAGRVMRREKYRTHQFSPPKLSPIRQMHPADLYDRPVFEPMGGPSDAEWAARQLVRDMTELDLMIARSEELMCAQAIVDGRITCYAIEGSPPEMLPLAELEYERQPRVVVAPPWTDPASDPLNDLKVAIREVSGRAGAQADFIALGSLASDLLETNQQTKDAYNLLWLRQGTLTPQETEWSVTSLGSFRGLNLYSYAAQFEHPFTGDLTPYLPPNLVIVASKVGGSGSLGYAGVWQEADEGNRHELFAGKRIWRQYFDDSEVRNLRCTSRPVPLPPNSRTYLILQVAPAP
jgi:hypothetical protein